MKGLLVIFGLLVLGVIIAAAVGAGIYNGLVGASQQVDSSWAQVQNVYQRRADLVPNLVATVKGAADFEKSTLIAVTDARASVGQVKIDPSKAPSDPAQLQQFEAAQQNLGGALSRLLVVAEKYPDLKATTNFQGLQAQLEGSENRISVERGRFNDAVQNYNTRATRFPTVLVARLFGFTPKPYFTATPAAQSVPQVNFDFSPQPTTAH